MAKTKPSGLAAVQNLYLMQFELMQHMDNGLQTPEQVREAEQCLKEFTSLLKVVDPQYMGGEDVLEALYAMHDKMADRVKKHAAKQKQKKGAAAKKAAPKKTAAAKTNKKTAAAKKAAPKKQKKK